MRSWLSCIPVAVALLSIAPAAHAQADADRATARELGQEGQAALDKKDYKTAEDRFKRANELFHAPTLALGYARAEAALGKVVNASETYNRIIREGAPAGAPAVFVAAVEAAKAEVGAVQARVASVTITVAGPDNPHVMLDDTAVPVAALGVKRSVDPGAHVVHVTADGWDPADAKFAVADAGAANATVTMTKSAIAAGPASAPAGGPVVDTANGSPAPAGADVGSASSGSTQRTIGYVALIAGGVGLAVGGITGALALGKHSTLSGECTNGSCPSSAQSDLDGYHSVATISTIGFIGGAVLAGGGLVLVLTAPKGSGGSAGDSGPHVAPVIGFGTLGASGTF